jgi:hypothetical protein
MMVFEKTARFTLPEFTRAGTHTYENKQNALAFGISSVKAKVKAAHCILCRTWHDRNIGRIETYLNEKFSSKILKQNFA